MTSAHESPDETTPTAADAAPDKAHGDPLLNAAQGEQGDQAEGSRHGHDAARDDRG